MSRPTLQNLFLAVLIGVVVGLSPHTSGHRVVPSVVGGAAAGAVTLGLLARRPRLDAARGLDRPSPALWACLAALVAVFLPTFRFLYESWTMSIWQDGHGIFMPLIVAFLVHRRLRGDPSDAEESSPWGLAFLAVGLSLVVYDAAIQTRLLSAIGLVICLPGLSLLVLGARRTRAIALPLFLALFMVPIPISFASDLRLPEATAALTEPMIEAFGVPALRMKTLFVLPHESFTISDACSGMAAFVASIALAIFLFVHTRSGWRRALLFLTPWPAVVIFSAIRCAALLVVSYYHGMAVMHMATHGLSGILAFWSIVAVLLLIAGRRTLREALA